MARAITKRIKDGQRHAYRTNFLLRDPYVSSARLEELKRFEDGEFYRHRRALAQCNKGVLGVLHRHTTFWDTDYLARSEDLCASPSSLRSRRSECVITSLNRKY
jgi:hypothetical protein